MATDVNTALQCAAIREGEAPAEPLRSVRQEPRPPTITVAVLFALEREAAPFRKLVRKLPHVRIAVSGVGHAKAREAATRLLDSSAAPAVVIAAGFCGALVPTLHVGDIVTSPRIFTATHLISTPQEKQRLAALHGADAVDMESAAIAAVCEERGVAFQAVRAVSDTVDTALSPELVRLLSGGNVSPWKATAALLKKPSLLGEFLRLARDTKLASRTLAAALMAIVTPQGSPSSSTSR
jgi:adenosylhomocysteine nucleosidase